EVTSEDVAVLHWVNTTGAQAVADDPNFFKKVFCINNLEQALYGVGSDYTSVSQVPDYTRGVGVTGPFGASLAGDNPASSTLLEDQGLADLAHFNVTGSGKVTKFVLKRLGVSGDDVFDFAFLFVNGIRVSDGLTFSDNTLTFNDTNGLFNAPATVAVRATVADAMSGKTVGVQLTQINDTTVSVSGNLHSIAAENGNLADVTISAASGGGTLDPQAEVTLWQGTLSSAVNDVYFKRLSLRLVGSAKAADFANFKLYVDGVQIATATGIDANDYVHFLGNTLVKTSTGSRIVKVIGDIVGGAGDTYEFDLRGSTTHGSYDLELVDVDYNVGIMTQAAAYPFGPASGTIGAASMTAVKASDSPSGDVVDGTDDVPLAKYTFTAYGEAIKVETLNFTASVSDPAVPSLRDGRVLINGTQYGSTQILTVASVATSVEYTVNYTFMPGVATTVELRADAQDGDSGTDLGDADIISGVLITGINNGEGLESSTIVDVPSSDLEGNNRTVVTGAVTLQKNLNYADQTVVPPQSAYKIGAYTITGSNAESTNLTTFLADINEVTGTTGAGELRDMYVKYGSQQTSVKSTVNASNSFSVNYTLGINEVLQVEVYATILSTASTSGHVFDTNLDVEGTTVSSGATLVVTDTDGQNMTIGAGSFTASLDTAVTPVARIVGDEQTVTAAAFKFNAVNESYKISLLNLTMPNATGISSVQIKDGSTVVASLPAQTDMLFYISTANQPNVAANTSKTLTVDLVLGTVASPGAGASGANHTVSLDVSDSRSIAGSTGTEAAITSADSSGNPLYAYKAVPTITALSLPTPTLVAGGAINTLAKFNVGSGGTGTITWIKAVWSFSDTANVDVSDIKVYDASNTQVPGTLSSASGVVTFLATNEQPVGDFSIKAQVEGAADGTDAVTVTWVASSSFDANAASSSATLTGTFIWSDNSNSPHVESSTDWTGDYLVKNIGDISWTLQD
ncbi:MAG TPA: hypothetical protein VJ553_05715, partial [Candidatus Paceibacterota bacterium]|nr:hypothetical protein [Candidatus Paceibacterota bacterium]